MAPKSKRRTATRRRKTTKRKRSTKVPRPLGTNKPVTFKRVLNAANAVGFIPDGTVAFKSNACIAYSLLTTGAVISYATLAMTCRLSDLPNYTEFTNMFDQYRINSVTIKMFSFATSSEAGAAVNPQLSQTSALVHSILDFDDATAPTASDAGIDVLRQFPSYKVRQLVRADGKPAKYTFRPHAAVSAYGTGAFTSYKNVPFGWVDANSPGVDGYGWKAIVELPSLGVGYPYIFYTKAEVTYNISFRNPR